MLFQNRGKLEIHLQGTCGPCIRAGVGATAPALPLLAAAAQVTVAPDGDWAMPRVVATPLQTPERPLHQHLPRRNPGD